MSKRYPQAVLVSCEAPWDENGELVESVFRDEVRKAISSGFRDCTYSARRVRGMR